MKSNRRGSTKIECIDLGSPVGMGLVMCVWDEAKGVMGRGGWYSVEVRDRALMGLIELELGALLYERDAGVYLDISCYEKLSGQRKVAKAVADLIFKVEGLSEKRGEAR